MPYVVGIVLAFGVALFARVVGLDRDRAFYPTVLIVIACTYVLFAAMGAPTLTLIVEVLVMTAFAGAAVIGFRTSAWVVVAGLAAHGLLDATHGFLIHNAGVPVWWPAFCAAYDIGAAGALAWLVSRRFEVRVNQDDLKRSVAPLS